MNISKESTPAKLRKASAAETCALEKLPHITKRVCLLWGHPEFDAFTSHLLMDSRDGKRQGLPWEVAEEILFLAELRVVKRAIVASGVTGQPFWTRSTRCSPTPRLRSRTSSTSGAIPWPTGISVA